MAFQSELTQMIVAKDRKTSSGSLSCCSTEDMIGSLFSAVVCRGERSLTFLTIGFREPRLARPLEEIYNQILVPVVLVPSILVLSLSRYPSLISRGGKGGFQVEGL